MEKENSVKSKMKMGGRLLTVFSLIVFLTMPFIFAGCNQPDDVGARLYSGTETPNLSFGKMGDFYIDEDDNLIYKFGSNGWYVIGNMQGEKGDQGEQGIQGEQGEKGDQGEPGVDGANGISFLSGQGTPSSSLGSVDDLYLNTLTYDLYKKSSTGWSSIGNIKGAQGEQGEQGIQGGQGEQGADGATILSGALDPISSDGKDGDIYINTMSQDLFQKVNGTWTQITNIRGETGATGITPHIGDNGNWWVGDEDTGFNALGSTIEIDIDGYLIINDVNSGYNLKLTSQELYSQLGGIIEYDDDNTSFTKEYEPMSVTYESLVGINGWEFTSNAFYGWAGSIGRPERINAIKFRVRARTEPITQIAVTLTENTASGKVLASSIISVNVEANQAKDIVWVLDEMVVNSTNTQYYFGYCCDAYTDKFTKGSADGISIPEEEQYDTDPEGVKYTMKALNQVLSSFAKTNVLNYLPVQIGTVTTKFKLSEKMVQQIIERTETEIYQNTDFVLPSTIYGYVGQTMQIYFRNICAYSLNDVYLKVESNGKGLQYSDRWEYTPESAETFNLTLELYTKNWNLISSSTFSVVIKDATTKTTANALVIGDSTVYIGDTEVKQMMTLSGSDDAFDLTLLGTMGTSPNNHEGRAGWSTTTYVSSATSSASNHELTNPFYNTSTSSFDFSYYMEQQSYSSVDVVFIQLGINDVLSGSGYVLEQKISTYISNMQTMINSIHTYNPDIKIVINLITPCSPNQDTFCQTYKNQTVWGYMRNMYKANQALLETFASTPNVYLSWFNATIDTETMLGGDVHPTPEGYNQLGTQMYYFMKAIL